MISVGSAECFGQLATAACRRATKEHFSFCQLAEVMHLRAAASSLSSSTICNLPCGGTNAPISITTAASREAQCHTVAAAPRSVDKWKSRRKAACDKSGKEAPRASAANGADDDVARCVCRAWPIAAIARSQAARSRDSSGVRASQPIP
jgi:hypothetical protein